jgi:F-type H+-transporting ATPase subunit beta
MANGKVAAVRGAVVDVAFEVGQMPEIYDALEIARGDQGRLVLEVQQQLEGGLVRTVAMDSTDGLARGTEVVATGQPILVPVGRVTLGRIFNVLGEPIDGQPVPKAEAYYPIHREAPTFAEQSTEVQTFETGVKVIDLVAPFIKGGKTAFMAAPAWARRSHFPSSSAPWPPLMRASPFSPVWVSAPARAPTSTTT